MELLRGYEINVTKRNPETRKKSTQPCRKSNKAVLLVCSGQGHKDSDQTGGHRNVPNRDPIDPEGQTSGRWRRNNKQREEEGNGAGAGECCRCC